MDCYSFLNRCLDATTRSDLAVYHRMCSDERQCYWKGGHLVVAFLEELPLLGHLIGLIDQLALYLFQKCGFLSSELKRLNGYLIDQISPIAVYMYTNPENFWKNKAVLIDDNHFRALPWKGRLFDPKDRLSIPAWETAMTPFIQDMAKLLITNALLSHNSGNLAICKNRDESYSVRYFTLFPYATPDRLIMQTPTPQKLEEAKAVIANAISQLFHAEFPRKVHQTPSDFSRPDFDFHEEINKNCMNLLLAEIKKNLPGNPSLKLLPPREKPKKVTFNIPEESYWSDFNLANLATKVRSVLSWMKKTS